MNNFRKLDASRFAHLPVLFFTILLAGCGGGDSGGNTSVNNAPMADAGADQSVNDAGTVTLDASGSSDSDGDSLSYSWAQTAGPDVTLSDAAAEKPTFTAPTVAGGTTLAFKLTVSDGKDSHSDSVNITVNDVTPATVATNDPIGVHDALVLTFDEAVNPDSLVLDGELVAQSDAGTWSAGNTVLTLAPAASDAWESGNRTLTLAVDDMRGNTMTLDAGIGVDFIVSSFKQAEVVIGQADFTGTLADRGGSAAADTLDTPYGVPSYINGVLWLADYANNRMAGFDGIPTTNGTAMSYVVGQDDFVSTAPGRSNTAITGPQQLLFYNDHYYLLEYDNARLLVFDSAPYLAPRTATAVLGQADFTSMDTSCTALNFYHPETMVIADGKLLVTDTEHNRVLIWDSVPTATGTPPDLVLGQSNFTHCTNDDDDQDGFDDGTRSARALHFPDAVWSDGTRLVVIDHFNSRALIWNRFPTTSFQPADLVLGQADFTGHWPNGIGPGAPPTVGTLNYPVEGLWSNGRQLLISDSSNNRVLVWNQFPTENFQPADAVLGQSDFVHAAANDDDQDGSTDTASARTLNLPGGLLVVRDKLIVQENGNNRALVYRAD